MSEGGNQFLVRDTRMPGHFWADNEVYDIFAPQLGAHGFAVYLALCRTAINGTGECRIAMSRIATQLTISKATVHQALGKIVETGLAQLGESGGPRKTALYLLADVKSLTDPTIAQMRLVSVRPPNAQPSSVRPPNAERSPTERNPNAAFAQRTPYKEDKTITRLNTKTEPDFSLTCTNCHKAGAFQFSTGILCGACVGRASSETVQA